MFNSFKSLNNIRQKGAMFGLDARIALLIVSILGLIIFPYILGVVSKAQADSIITATKSVSQAVESYILDTGSVPASIDMLYDTAPVKPNQALKWNGPYLKGDKTDYSLPAISWVTVDDDCTNALKSSSYCSLRLEFEFCDVSRSVNSALQSLFVADQISTYTSATKCVKFGYGHANTAADTSFIAFKVKELP